MRVFSTFTGIGGFEIGIQNAYRNTHGVGSSQASRDNEENREGLQRPTRQDSRTEEGQPSSSTGHSTIDGPLFVGYSEIDKFAISVYERHFEGVENYGDITKINASELPDFDCLVGGFPCQAFSIAGKRGGFADTRGTLFFDLARILDAKRPRLFVFENVKGLLSHDSGNTFKTIIATITELGYDCQWQVLNSKDFGVPQNRERIIIVGHLRGTPRPEVFPIVGGNSKTLVEITKGVSDAQRIYTPQLAKSQKALGGGMGAKTGLYAVHKNHGSIEPTDDTAHALDANYYKGLDNHGQRTAIANGDLLVRRLTPKECERLQGFPDDWTKEGVELCMGKLCKAGEFNGCLGHFVPISDTQRYKMCGNAVTTKVIEAVFTKIFSDDCVCFDRGQDDGNTTCWVHHDCLDGSCTHTE